MYLLENLLAEMVKVTASLGVAGFLAAPPRQRRREQHRYTFSDVLVEVLKIVVSVAIGALLGAWRERKRSEQVRQQLLQLRQSIGQDVQQMLTEWGAQGTPPADRVERPADRDEVPVEPIVVSGRDEA